MRLVSWRATASGRALIVEGTNEHGIVIELSDVAEIRNDVRAGTTVAIRKKPLAGEAEQVKLS